MNDETIIALLNEGFKRLNVKLNYEPFLTYIKLLNKWNKTYNLTAIRNIDDMVKYHILDSLAIIPWVKGDHIIDVGSGPGLPGIPLALAFKDKKIFLLDSNIKKINFLEEVKRILCLTNVEIIHQRVENYYPEKKFSTIVTRAFSDLNSMVKITDHLLAKDGIWLAMKGKIEDEINKIDKVFKIYEYQVPGLAAKRSVVLIS